jgi:hypothetical protein
MSAAMPVTAGFWDVGLEVMKESNHNGIVGKDVSFSSAAVLTSAWSVAMGPGSFTGFLDIVGPKGKRDVPVENILALLEVARETTRRE